MTEKGKRYKDLIKTVKADYSKNIRRNTTVALKWYEDCKEINLWTYWQGLGYAENTPDIDILLVGQDWGNPFSNPSETVINVKKINKAIEMGEAPISYLQDVNMDRRDCHTDYNLVQIFKETKNYDIGNQRYYNLFFTNFSLGYRVGSGTGGMTESVMKQDAKYFVELCKILQPQKIICLGQVTYKSVLSAYGIKPKKYNTYNDLIKAYKATVVDCEDKKSEIYAVAHCGLYGTRNREDIPKTKVRKEDLRNQIVDWKRVLV